MDWNRTIAALGVLGWCAAGCASAPLKPLTFVDLVNPYPVGGRAVVGVTNDQTSFSSYERSMQRAIEEGDLSSREVLPHRIVLGFAKGEMQSVELIHRCRTGDEDCELDSWVVLASVPRWPEGLDTAAAQANSVNAKVGNFIGVVERKGCCTEKGESQYEALYEAEGLRHSGFAVRDGRITRVWTNVQSWAAPGTWLATRDSEFAINLLGPQDLLKELEVVVRQRPAELPEMLSRYDLNQVPDAMAVVEQAQGGAISLHEAIAQAGASTGQPPLTRMRLIEAARAALVRLGPGASDAERATVSALDVEMPGIAGAVVTDARKSGRTATWLMGAVNSKMGVPDALGALRGVAERIVPRLGGSPALEALAYSGQYFGPWRAGWQAFAELGGVRDSLPIGTDTIALTATATSTSEVTRSAENEYVEVVPGGYSTETRETSEHRLWRKELGEAEEDLAIHQKVVAEAKVPEKTYQSLTTQEDAYRGEGRNRYRIKVLKTQTTSNEGHIESTKELIAREKRSVAELEAAIAALRAREPTQSQSREVRNSFWVTKAVWTGSAEIEVTFPGVSEKGKGSCRDFKVTTPDNIDAAEAAVRLVSKCGPTNLVECVAAHLNAEIEKRIDLHVSTAGAAWSAEERDYERVALRRALTHVK